jgi:hypothetical protein
VTATTSWDSTQYIYRRAQELSKLLAADLELAASALSAPPQRVFVERLSSFALGTTTCRTSACPAGSCSDTMNLVQRDHKLDSYTLNTVANTSSAT